MLAVFGIGLLIGACFGVGIMCCFFVSKEEDLK